MVDSRAEKVTALYERHVRLGAKFAPFAGYQMPIHYGSTIEEHQAVRKSAALFDVSHMGCIDVEGKDAALFLDFLSTQRIKERPVGSATYTLFPNEKGGVIDDLIIYRLDVERFFLVVNASRKEVDLRHLAEYAGSYRVHLRERFDLSIIALQGPDAASHFSPFREKKAMQVWEEGALRLATTGYTGEKGGEIIGKSEEISSIWDELIKKGVKAAGLGARDTLRLEKGYALYGHELSEAILPTESVSAWTVATEARDFLGKGAMLHPKRFPAAITLNEGIAREGAEVFSQEEKIGVVTSGGFSPSLNCGIALLLVDRKMQIGDHVDVVIRGRKVRGAVRELPFYKGLR